MNIRYVWGYIKYKVEKFWLTLNDNIDLQKYMQISDTNLRRFCCRRFCGKTFIIKDEVQRHAVDNFSRELKTKNNISRHDLASRSPDLNVTKDVFLAIIILKLYIQKLF